MSVRKFIKSKNEVCFRYKRIISVENIAAGV